MKIYVPWKTPCIMLAVLYATTVLAGCHAQRPTGGGGALSIMKIAAYSPSARPTEAVRKECQLDTKLPNYISAYAKRHFDQVAFVDSVSPTTPGKVVTAKITYILAPGGGAYSGPKSLTMEGVVRDNGKVIGTFTARRQVFAHVRPGVIVIGAGASTCGLMDKVAKELGKDVALWLEAPSMNARLGDAK